MKNIYIIPFVFSCFFAKAQSEIGVKGGINMSNLDGSHAKCDLPLSKSSFSTSFFVAVKIFPSAYFQPEINFTQQGGNQTGMQQVPHKIMNIMDLNDVNLYADFRNVTAINYVEIPLLVKFILGRKLKYYACFGPYIAFLYQATLQTSGNSYLYLNRQGTLPFIQKESPYPSVSLYHIVNIKEDIKQINAGVQGSLGLQYPLGPGNVMLEYRTNIGITNIQSHPQTDGKNQTSSLAVLLGYSIRIQ